MYNKLLLLSCLLLLSFTPNGEEGLLCQKECKRQATFLFKTTIDPQNAAFSTTEKKEDGITVIDVKNPNNKYIHPSWRGKGKMGPLAIDELGNCYVCPIPFVNLLDAKRKNQNVIYKINAATGELTTIFTALKTSNTNTQNAYGFVGLFYDCTTKLLYATSINGSTRKSENGIIYCLDISKTPAVLVDKFVNTDAMGIAVAKLNGQRKLFYGSTRDNNVYSIDISENGKFVSNTKSLAFTLQGLGPRGDDVVKKIRGNATDNTLTITGFPFYYNLTAPTTVPESKYKVSFSLNKWSIVEQK